MAIERVNVLGVGISVINLPTALTAIGDAVRARRKGYICVTGVHGVMEAQSRCPAPAHSESGFSLHAGRDADGLDGLAARPP